MYIYENPDWPNFTFDNEIVLKLLSSLRAKQGYLLGKMHSLGFQFQEKASLRVLTEDVIQSSKIEGQKLNAKQVRSSIAKRLGMEPERNIKIPRNVDGIVEVMLDATQNFNTPITKERLCGWQSAIFPNGFSGVSRIKTGDYRDEPSGNMQIVSGAIGHEKVHYQAPRAEMLDKEMDRLIGYINDNDDHTDLVIKAGIVHLWFVIIHPFEDGNGRIARALCDMLLARSENSPNRFYSMSSQIEKVRNSYYKALEITGNQSLDITAWISWFLENLSIAIEDSDRLTKSTLQRAEFRTKHRDQSFNDRQRKMLNKLLDDFEEHLTTTKWAKICKCSQDTATRDITDLMEKKILLKIGEARATHYIANMG